MTGNWYNRWLEDVILSWKKIKLNCLNCVPYLLQHGTIVYKHSST